MIRPPSITGEALASEIGEGDCQVGKDAMCSRQSGRVLNLRDTHEHATVQQNRVEACLIEQDDRYMNLKVPLGFRRDSAQCATVLYSNRHAT